MRSELETVTELAVKPEQEEDVAVLVEGVSKKFCHNLKRSMLYGTQDLLKGLVGIPPDTSALRKAEFWALKDINFKVMRGETIGIIGFNGSGKSTLLRLLTNIFPPDTGKITIRGKVSALVAVGAGFHPHLTGRENVFLNGTLLGMTRSEISEKFDSITQFADIGDFIEAPVSTYSSGMVIRLGFSIASHCEPDILIADEILSVGDYEFQNKSMDRISQMRKRGVTTLYVSHQMDYVRFICNRAILIHEGQIIEEGDVDHVIAQYYRLGRGRTVAVENESLAIQDDRSVMFKEVSFLDAGVLNEEGEVATKLKLGDDVRIFWEFKANEDVERPVAGVGFYRKGVHANVAFVSNFRENKMIKLPSLKKGKSYRIDVVFKDPRLVPGVYTINSVLRDGDRSTMLQHLERHKKGNFSVEDIPLPISNFSMENRDSTFYHMASIVDLEYDFTCREI
jgi:lipopolysaccharide transport system ATP-binding protein